MKEETAGGGGRGARSKMVSLPSSPWWRRRNRRACAGPAPSLRRSLTSSLPACLRSVRFLGSRYPPRPAALLPPPGPRRPGFLPSRRAREEWIAGGSGASRQGRRWTKRGTVRSSGWVGQAQVWSGSGSGSGSGERGELGKEEAMGVCSCLVAGFGSLVCGVGCSASPSPPEREHDARG